MRSPLPTGPTATGEAPPLLVPDPGPGTTLPPVDPLVIVKRGHGVFDPDLVATRAPFGLDTRHFVTGKQVAYL